MQIIKTLQQAGIDFYFVGGYVRDKLLNRESNDIDLVVSQPLEEIYPLIHGKKILVKGSLIRLLDEAVEITRLKGTLEADLRSRDFTINALALSPEGKLTDVVGGLEDCRKGILRAISEDNLVADFCRALKGVRQVTELGFTIDTDTEELIIKHAALISTIPPERLRLELDKILLLPKPSLAFELLRKTKLLKKLMPDLAVLYGVKQNPNYHQYDVYQHTLHAVDNASIEGLDQAQALILRLAALGHDWGKLAVQTINPKTGYNRYIGHEKESVKLFSQFLRNLTYGYKLISQVSDLIKEHMKQSILLNMSDYKVRQFLFVNRGIKLDLLLRLFSADAMAKGNLDEDELQERISLIEKRLEGCRLDELQVTGSDILKHSAFRGPDIGRVKDQLQQMVLERPELNEREILLRILVRLTITQVLPLTR